MYSNCYLKCTSSTRLQNQWLASVTITEEEIYLLFKNLNLEKAHGLDDISVRRIHLCGEAIVEPLQIFFLPFKEDNAYPDDLKKRT